MNGILLGLSAAFFGLSAAFYRLGLFYLQYKGNDKGLFARGLSCLVIGAGFLTLSV